MLLVNKLAVSHLPSPAIVTISQFASASILIHLLKWLNVIQVDELEWSRGKYFLIYVALFSIGTWTNMKVLAIANVETVIVFRSCTPLAVCLFDYCFYDRALPGVRSTAALFLLVVGVFCYISSDRDFQLNGVAAYYFVLVWWSVLVIQLTYGKFLVSGLNNRSIWTPVLYVNTLSVPASALIGFVMGELESSKLAALELTAPALGWLILSCIIGLSISWAGFHCQSLCSATTYTVVGVMNKILTVTVNVLIWDKHASASGIGSLVICLAGGSLYKQAPLRSAKEGESKALVMVSASAETSDSENP